MEMIMPRFSQTSKERLKTCHPWLQDLFNEIIKLFDCTIICGYRNKESQMIVYQEGRSNLQYPNSKHNKTPSLAVDVAPYPIEWHNVRRFYYFAGYVMGIAAKMKIPLRWGGDWNSNTIFNDQGFYDLPHFELTKE